MILKKFVLPLILSATCMTANADLIIHHREGSAPIAKFDLKIMSMDGRTCYERQDVSEFTQKISITDEQLERCGTQPQYVVYGILKGWTSDSTFYGDNYPKNGGECTVSHEKDGYFYTKLQIKCSK